jgi:hypothetical protein
VVVEVVVEVETHQSYQVKAVVEAVVVVAEEEEEHRMRHPHPMKVLKIESGCCRRGTAVEVRKVW